jgi:fucose 4-O-acetylase-like acetyltransferase
VSTLGVASGVFGTVAQTADIEERPQNLSPSGGVSVGGFPRLLISAAGGSPMNTGHWISHGLHRLVLIVRVLFVACSRSGRVALTFAFSGDTDPHPLSSQMTQTAIYKARALGIIAVVYGHVHPGLGLEVGLFHMPLFFFLGGLTLSPERSIKKVARFVLVDMLFFAVAATFFYSILAAALEPLGLKFRLFSDWSPAHFTVDMLRHTSHHVQFALTAWFLVAYAGAVVVAELATRTIRLKHGTLLVLTALAVLMFYFGVRIIAPLYTKEAWYWNWVSQVSVGGAFMIAGYVAMRSGRLITLTTSVAWVAFTYLSFWYIAKATNAVAMGMVFSKYPMGLLHGVLAVLGILGTLQLAALLDKAPSAWFLDRIGKASKQVMIHHLFVFTLINLAFVALGLMSIAEISGVYSKYRLLLTWPLYLILGTLVPWLAYELFVMMNKRYRLPAFNTAKLDAAWVRNGPTSNALATDLAT